MSADREAAARDSDGAEREEEASDDDEPSDATVAGAAAAAAKKKKKKKRKPAAGAPLPSFAHVKHRVPWTIKALPGRGRCAIATRAIAAGELLLLERAIAFVPRDRYAQGVCHHCLADLPTARIGADRFCSSLCAAAAGPEHAAFCSLEAAIAGASAETGVDAELLRLVAALALAQDATPQTDDNGDVAAPLRGTVADVSSLRAPGDGATGNSPPEPPLVAAFAALLRLAGEARLGRDATSLARLAAIVNGNAHGLGAPRNVDGSGSADVAAGLFPFLSMFNHSCAPRAVFAAAAPGGVMAVRALVACAAGEELTVSYINLYESRASRRAATLATKGFACACERCAAPLAGSFDRRLQGAACRCGDVFIPDEGAPADPLGWRCAGCGKHDGGTGAAAASAAAAELDAAMRAYVERGHGAAEPLLAALLSRHGKTLSEHHVTLFDARTPALNCARARADAATAITHCTAIIASLEGALGPCAAAETANFHACLGDLYTQRADATGAAPLRKSLRAKSRDAFARAAAARTLCLGPDHPATAAVAALAAARG